MKPIKIAMILIITFLIGLPLNVSAIDWKYETEGNTANIHIYGQTDYDGMEFDGSTGQLGDVTLPDPYNSLTVEGLSSNTISGGAYTNLEVLEFWNATSNVYLDLTNGATSKTVINNVDNVYLHQLEITSGTVEIKNVQNFNFYSNDNPLNPVTPMSYTIAIKGTDNKKLVIENSVLNLNGAIYIGGSNAVIYINNTIIDLKTDLTANSVIWCDTTVLTSGNDNVKLYLNNVVIHIHSYLNGKIPLNLQKLDYVYIDNVNYTSDSINYFESFVYLDNIYGGYLKNCDIHNTLNGISISTLYGDFYIENNKIHDCAIIGDETPTGINMDDGQIKNDLPSQKSQGKYYIIGNKITDAHIGIKVGLIDTEIRNNTISNFQKNTQSILKIAVGIIAMVTESTVPSYINQIHHEILSNKIVEAEIGMAIAMNVRANYNIILNCTNAIAGTPPYLNNYDGFYMDARNNYLGTDYPVINRIDYLDTTKALNGEYEGDIIDGSSKYQFVFVYEPFAIKKWSLEKTTQKIRISLNVGWNLVYLPYELPANYNLYNLFAIGQNVIKAIVIKEGDQYKVYANTESMQEINTNTLLRGGQGIYILSLTKINIYLPIGNIKTVYTFQKGWNLFGYPAIGYTFVSWVEQTNQITAIVYRDNNGQYIPISVTHPLDDYFKEQLYNIKPYQGVYIFFSEGTQFYLDCGFYDPSSDTVIPANSNSL